MSKPQRGSVIANQIIDTCVSTNDLARELGEQGCPDGTWISARRQTKGRGRQGREWKSEDGNLFLSIVKHIPQKEIWTWVPLATTVGIVGTIKSISPDLNVKIKWPNDLTVNSAKLGGVLCENISHKPKSFFVIGIGLNCVNAPEVDVPTVALEADADEVRPQIIKSVLKALDHLQKNGTESIKEFYETFAALEPGSSIAWTEQNQKQEGKVIGLGQYGELLVDCNGKQKPLFAEDVLKIR